MNANRKTACMAGAVAVVLAGVFVAFLVTSAPAPKHTTAVHTSTKASCNAGTTDSTIPTAPPADLLWKNVGAFTVPTSATYGPTSYRGAVWSCYRHDPMGAVIAVYVIMAGLASQNWHAVAHAQIVPGPGQQAFIAASDQQSFQPASPDQVAQPVGFQVVTYTPQQATIDALADAGDNQYQAEQTTVAWSGGDWKLVATPDGETGPDPQFVSSANGFILWGGTGG
jgi:hypothetical protein